MELTLKPILPEPLGTTDPQRLAIAALAWPVPPPELRDSLAEILCAPAAELFASPISSRIAGLAAAQGRAFTHHELRMPPPLAEGLQPELDVGWAGDGAAWRSGRLEVPKYFSAFLDAPLPTFNPNHRGKWRPHELLHRLSAFAWSPDIDRFSAYVSARLSELLPVVHWYGFDEIGRARCPLHRGEIPSRTLCDACERAAEGSTPDQSDANAEHALGFATSALAHLESELSACRQELESGRIVATPRVGLDASSDAVGYMRAHWNRITGWSFGAWIERFATPGVEVFESSRAHLEHVEALAEHLLGGTVRVERAAALLARDRHMLQDLGYRALLCLEAIDRDDVEQDVLPAVDRLATVAKQSTAEERKDAIEDLSERLGRFAPDAANVVLAGGWTWEHATPGHVTQHIAGGLRDGLPRSLADVDATELAPLLDTFIDNPQFNHRGDLADRFSAFLAEHAAPPSWAEQVRLESWLLAPPLMDLEAERFGAIPEPNTGTDGRLRTNTTLRIAVFSREAAAAVLDWPDAGSATVTLAAVQFGGTPRAVEVDEDVRDVLDAVAAGSWQDNEASRALLECGLLVWFPQPR